MVDTCPDCHGELVYTVEVIDIFQDEPQYQQVECVPCMARLSAELRTLVQHELEFEPTLEFKPTPVDPNSPEQVAGRRESWEKAHPSDVICDASDWQAAKYAGVLFLFVIFIIWAMTR